jgi:small GTP-binding protein
MMSENRVVFAGGSAVGKTSLILRIAKQDFSEFTTSTVGNDVYPINVDVKGPKGNATVVLNLIDTAGQEKYRSLSSFFFRGARAAILCYDITRRDTLKDAREFYDTARDGAEPDCQFVLVGTKSDMEEQREVNPGEAEDLANEFKAAFTAETSAKTGEGVEDLFARIGQLLSAAPSSAAATPALDVTVKKGGKDKCC